MRIWLDDERDPADPYIQRDFGAVGDEIWCKTCYEAANLIMKGEVTYISFDHDLGRGPNGYKLAKWIEKQAYEKAIPKIKWSIHTQNIVGFKNIMAALKKADGYWNEQN